MSKLSAHSCLQMSVSGAEKSSEVPSVSILGKVKRLVKQQVADSCNFHFLRKEMVLYLKITTLHGTVGADFLPQWGCNKRSCWDCAQAGVAVAAAISRGRGHKVARPVAEETFTGHWKKGNHLGRGI